MTIRQPPKRFSDTPSGRAEQALQTANAISQIITKLGTLQPLDDQLSSLSELDYTGNAAKVIAVNAGATAFELGEIPLASYTVATLPSAAAPIRMIYVTDETGGAVPAFNDGTNWRRVTDRAIVA